MIETDADKAIDPRAARYWREIERYNRATSDWYTEGAEIEDIYLDANRTAASARKFSLLWTNVETLKPSVYARTPTMLCSRRYKDRDTIARTAAELIERATNTTMDIYGTDEVFRMVRDDRLLPGRGQAWVRYEAQIEKTEGENVVVDPDTNEETVEPFVHERLVNEKACADYVNWKDFGHNVSGTWKDVWLCWRIVYKTEEEVVERFGSEAARGISYNAKPPAHGSGASSDGPDSCCRIYEIWDRRAGTVSWMAEGKKTFLESGPPPIKFANGFPCPEPCYATKTSKSLIPQPDYRYYRDQAKEINDLTDKIHRLSQWLIVKGFIPGGPSTVSDPLEEALQDKGNAELFLKIDSWRDFTDKGGSAKLIDWLPIDKVVQALQAAITARNQLIQDVFQLTGISDILRGQTDPNETLGAQELKAQTGNRRLRNTKDELARFTKDIGALMAEVIAEKFEPKSIAEITGYKYVPSNGAQPQMMGLTPEHMAMLGHNGGPDMAENEDDPELVFDDRHIELLRNDRLRSFRIDIENDSTIQADENAEKRSRIEFVGAYTKALETAAMVAEKAPELAQAMGDSLAFLSRGFRAGRSLEEGLEKGFRAMAQRLAKARAAGPPPDPRVIEAQTNAKLAVAEAQTDAQLDAKKQDTDAQLEIRKQNIDAQLATRKQNLDVQSKMKDTTVAANAQALDAAQRMLARLKPQSMVQ